MVKVQAESSIGPRLGSGLRAPLAPLDEEDVIEMAERTGEKLGVSEVVGAVRDIYDRAPPFAAAEAFELAATMLGDRELAADASLALVSEDAIDLLTRRLSELPSEIARLVEEGDRKGRGAEELLGKIEARKMGVARERSKPGFGAIWRRLIGRGVSATPIDRVFAEDAELRRLERGLEELDRERSTIVRSIERLRTPRPDIERTIGRLREVASGLFETLREGPPAGRGRGLLRHGADEAMLRRRERLLTNLEGQRVILESLKVDAEAIGVKLDPLTAHLASGAESLRAKIASLR